MSTLAGHDAVVIHDSDNVATLLRDASAGERLRVRHGTTVIELVCGQQTRLCHKLALLPIAAGGEIRKYGEVIGQATGNICAGEHVHVHNLRSLRNRSVDPAD